MPFHRATKKLWLLPCLPSSLHPHLSLGSIQSCMKATTTGSVATLLNELIETCKDGQDGFRAAREGVKNTDFRALFHNLSMQRLQFSRELQNFVRELDEKPERRGSVVGSMHRGWIQLKAAITSGSEHSILAECERGEKCAVEQYRKALEHEELPDHIRNVLRLHFMGVQGACEQIAELMAHFPAA